MLSRQNGQTYSNNSLATTACKWFLSVFDHFVGLAPYRVQHFVIYHIMLEGPSREIRSGTRRLGREELIYANDLVLLCQ